MFKFSKDYGSFLISRKICNSFHSGTHLAREAKLGGVVRWRKEFRKNIKSSVEIDKQDVKNCFTMEISAQIEARKARIQKQAHNKKKAKKVANKKQKNKNKKKQSKSKKKNKKLNKSKKYKNESVKSKNKKQKKEKKQKKGKSARSNLKKSEKPNLQKMFGSKITNSDKVKPPKSNIDSMSKVSKRGIFHNDDKNLGNDMNSGNDKGADRHGNDHDKSQGHNSIDKDNGQGNNNSNNNNNQGKAGKGNSNNSNGGTDGNSNNNVESKNTKDVKLNRLDDKKIYEEEVSDKLTEIMQDKVDVSSKLCSSSNKTNIYKELSITQAYKFDRHVEGGSGRAPQSKIKPCYHIFYL